MNKPGSRNFLLIGLPGTGKTSFLAALWYAIQQNVCSTRLVLKKLDGDSTYLSGIRTAWLQYRTVARTPTDTERFVSMWLKNRETEDEIRLVFPDVSGESFVEQWAGRHLSVTYNECLKGANGALLFVHPSSIVQPIRINAVDDLAALIDDEVAAEPTEPMTSAPPPTPWKIESSPTQVQLVALLQFLREQPHFRPIFPLAIVVSAWDLVNSSGITPEKWVEIQLPLLHQFLISNQQLFKVRYYGISAQGSKYEGNDLAALQAKNPAKRIEIVGEGITNRHDITEPLQWLMQ